MEHLIHEENIMKNNKFFVLILSLILMVTISYAGDVARTGTTAGTQLLIPVGARSIAMGNAAIASARGVEAIFWNPAGMSVDKKSEVMFSTYNYIADITQNYLAGVLDAGSFGTIGFHIQSLDFGDIEETTVDQPTGTGRTYSPTFFVAGLTYSRFLTDHIIAGVTGKLISEEIMQTGGTALAFDMGIRYLFNENFSLGVTMKNVGTKLIYNGRNLERTAQIEGSNLLAEDGYYRAIAQAAELPSVFSFGVSYKYDLSEEANVRVNGAFVNNNDYYDEVYTGAEFGYNDLLFLRAGYQLKADQVDNQDDNLFGLTLGAGLKYQVGGFNLYLDYAFRQVNNFFGNTQVFAIKIGY